MSQGQAFNTGHYFLTAFEVRILIEIPVTPYYLSSVLVKYQTHNCLIFRISSLSK